MASTMIGSNATGVYTERRLLVVALVELIILRYNVDILQATREAKTCA